MTPGALTQGRLKNGLEYKLIHNPTPGIFHFQTWFKVGSRDEQLDPKLGRTGLAHLFEHMMFRGTRTRPDGQFDRILTRNGSRGGNATTWLDRTNYFESMPSSKLELVMELEADRMAGLALDHDLLEAEKGAVVGEFRMYQDDPQTVAYERLYEHAFTVHPYRSPVIGTEEWIRGFSVEEAEYFYRKYYSPSNATLLLVGDIDPDQAQALIQKHYGSIASHSIQRPPCPAEPAQTAQRRVVFEHAQLSAPKLALGYVVPEVTHPDQPALHVLVSLLTYGQGARLEKAWVDAGITVEASGTLDQLMDPGLLTLGGDLQEGRSVDHALRSLDQQLRGLDELSGSGLEQEVERAKNQLLLSIQQSWTDNEDLASYLGEFMISGGSLDLGIRRVDQIASVEPEQVKQVARRYLIPGRRTVIEGKPA